MSQPSTLQALFNAALQGYEDKTGNSLADHPFARLLQECDSVESISTILEEQARVFREFRDHGKLINSLKRLAGILCSPFISNALGESIGLVVRPKGVCLCELFLIVHSHFRLQKQYLLAWPSYSPYVSHPPVPSTYFRDIRVPQAVKDVSSSYDALVDLFASFEKFLSRLCIYTEIPLTQALKTVLVEIIVELLSTLALATKQVKQGRFSEFILAGMTLD
jgi:hypothetical protein